MIPIAYDWVYAYRPACWMLLTGQSPYTITSEKFANAPWALLPLLPLSLLPDWLGYLFLVLISIAAFIFVARKLGGRALSMMAFMLSPFVVYCLYYGQIDWIPLLGVVLPPWLGLFFIAVKPQTCGLVAIYWLYEAWKTGTIIKTFAPVTIITLLSFIPFGFWPMKATGFGQTNVMWPFSLILSVVLLIVSHIRKDKILSAAASSFASPYVRIASYSGLLLPLMRYQCLMIIVVITLWIARIV